MNDLRPYVFAVEAGSKSSAMRSISLLATMIDELSIFYLFLCCSRLLALVFPFISRLENNSNLGDYVDNICDLIYFVASIRYGE